MIILLVLVILVQPYAIAEDDIIYFLKNSSRTEFLLVGEDEISIVMVFPEDITMYGLAMNNSIFKSVFSESTISNYSAGHKLQESVYINPEVKPGEYQIDITFYYINTNNLTVYHNITLPLTVVKAFEITDIHIPSGLERSFTIDVRTYIDLTTLTVSFDSDGDIELKNASHRFTTVAPGDYSFTSELVMGSGRDQQELGYHVIGEIENNRSAEFFEFNIPVEIEWKDDNGHIVITNKDSFAIKIGILVLLLFAVNTLRYIRYRSQ